MKNYEKRSFYKIFLGYLISVSIFILLLGFLYFQQHRNIILQNTAMNMHQFLLHLKETNFQYKQAGYSYDISDLKKVEKQLPRKKGNIYFKAFSNKFIININANIVDDKIYKLKYFTIILQIFLIIIFSFISYILAKRSLQPMVDTISHLDRFIGDLIHDLNTPITSILLNTKMLSKDANSQTLKKINRIQNSATNISSLYENLELILEERNSEKKDFDLNLVIIDIIETYKVLYPKIIFDYSPQKVNINSNQNAIKRIIDNIISNACKYSIEDNPLVIITFDNNTLIIKDNGKGIKYPKKIFERNYKESQVGYGIGMHIVHRLCNQLSLGIDIESQEYQGTTVSITF